MAKAIIAQDGDGGLEVRVPAWENALVSHMTAYSVNWLLEDRYDDPQDVDTDGYKELAVAITERLWHDYLKLGDVMHPDQASNYTELYSAVLQAVSPGPPIEEPLEFTV